MGQFDLHFRIGCLGPLGENLEDQAGTVYHVAACDDFFDVSLLGAGQFVVEDDILDLVLFAIVFYFIQFSCADIGCLVGTVHALHEGFVADGTGCFCQKPQFVQILRHFSFAPFFQDDADKHGFLRFILTHILNPIAANLPIIC